MSWSYRIAILYIGFVGIILTLVFTCINQKIELESPDYYAKELAFQDQINATDNVRKLKTPIAHNVSGKTIELILPQELLTSDFQGKVHLMRPSDSSLDRWIDLSPDANGRCRVTAAGLSTGVYRMCVHITIADTKYYLEEVINLK